MVDLKHLTQSPCTSWSLPPPGRSSGFSTKGHHKNQFGPARESGKDRTWGHPQRQPLAPWLLLYHLVPALLPSASLLVVQLLRNHKLPWSTRNHRLHAMRTLALTHSVLFPGPHRTSRNHWCVSRSKLGSLPRGCEVFLAFLLQ